MTWYSLKKVAGSIRTLILPNNVSHSTDYKEVNRIMGTSNPTRSKHLAFRGLCLQRGFNSKRLAAAIGLSTTEMSNRVRGVTPWRWPEALAVCKALGVNLDEFAQYYPE